MIKRITSAIAGLSIIFSVVSPVAGVSAAYTSLEAANKLATFGVIVDQSSNPANYRLGDTISRKEMAKVTMNLSSSDVTNSCQEIFSDLPSSDWGCKYAEAGLSLGFFASNSEFRPNDDISKWEALKFIMQARGLEKGNDSDFRKAYVDAAVEAGIATYFSDYNTAITRGQIFIWAAEALELEEDDDDDLLSDLLGNLDPDDEDDEDMDDDKDTTDPFLPVVNTLTVSLSPETPGSSTVPKSVSGLPVARFDFTAGSEDVTVTSLTVKRRGLSDKDTLDSLAVFVDGIRGSKGRNDSLENNTEALLTLANQGLVIQAGETKTLTIVADTGDDDSIE
ncbi:MAG: S-layer homology domain-containing protein [Nitrosopumilaceae archaeon]|nr:S-layer homology domain-containing protein [Nitrosopumilaceae archaeon]